MSVHLYSFPSPCSSTSVQQHDKQNQNNDQYPNRQPAPILLGLPTNAFDPRITPIQRALMPIHTLVHIPQHDSLFIQLCAHLNAQIALTPDTAPQRIQLIVLVAKYLLVEAVDLLIRELALVRCAVIWLVAVGFIEEC